MKNFAVSFMLLFAYVAVFPEESPTLSIHDFVGTYRLVRIENPWLSDEVREKVNSGLLPYHNTFVIGEDYWILGNDTPDKTSFVLEEIDEEGVVGHGARHGTTLLSGVFLDVPRIFNHVFHVSIGPIQFIEVFDCNTVAFMRESSWLLYKRVE